MSIDPCFGTKNGNCHGMGKRGIPNCGTKDCGPWKPPLEFWAHDDSGFSMFELMEMDGWVRFHHANSMPGIKLDCNA